MQQAPVILPGKAKNMAITFEELRQRQIELLDRESGKFDSCLETV